MGTRETERLIELNREFIFKELPLICKSERRKWTKYPHAGTRGQNETFFPPGSSIQHRVIKTNLELGTLSLSFMIRFEFKRKSRDERNKFEGDIYNRLHRYTVSIEDHASDTGLKHVNDIVLTSGQKADKAYLLLRELFEETWEMAIRCNVCTRPSRVDAMRKLILVLNKNRKYI